MALAERVVGAQRPRIRLVPPAASTGAAREAIELGAAYGVDLDPWQKWALEDALGERSDGSWASFEVGIIDPRQNGKGKIIEVRELSGLTLFGERLIIHTAHEVKTAAEAFIRIRDLFTNYDDLRRETKRINNSHGEEGIELRNGARLRFLARSRMSGRGFSGDTIFFDEAFHLPDASMAALLPTMSAMPNPQLWYLSSSVNQVHHVHGHVLARLRRRGLRTDSPRLTYLEWSLMEREDWEALAVAERERLRADPESWRVANPGYGYRISEEFTRAELGALDAADFDVERLGIGDWPTDETESWLVISEAAWSMLVDRESSAEDPVAMSLDTTPDRSWTSIAAAGRRSDGLVHVEVIEHRTGTDWAVARVAELIERHRPCAFVIDESGPAASLVPGLERAGVELDRAPAREVAAGCDHFLDLVRGGTLRHRDQPELMRALAGAKKRVIGDEKQWAWARKGIQVVISPLIAATQAAYGLEMYASRAGQFFAAWR